MIKYIIDCSGIKTEDEFWDAYVGNVDTYEPEKFGRNLDALWDALHAGAPGSPTKSCFISVRKTENLKALREGYFYDHLRQIAYDLSTIPGNPIKFRVN
ncbi:barstar family protein [Simiduia sp. 21SJ11W-1]|uniref:barstar family protein n=1 Tax=Simiduia sp. 21SJ11W-1 TaxID=2909669 RepID=UPI0020A09827|nr:barstar family protein [Simiduia sp. 21SJ11W-1]UTA48263.1 barstar family protein [Simiduia sp. 21SJ11W-1]